MNNLIEVSKEKFLAELKADSRDIMPKIVGKYPYVSMWETNDGARVLFGKSQERKYWLAVRS